MHRTAIDRVVPTRAVIKATRMPLLPLPDDSQAAAWLLPKPDALTVFSPGDMPMTPGCYRRIAVLPGPSSRQHRRPVRCISPPGRGRLTAIIRWALERIEDDQDFGRRAKRKPPLRP
jgi:hypothetical protein